MPMICLVKITNILALILVLEFCNSTQGLVDPNDRPNDGGYDDDYLRDLPAAAVSPNDQPAMEYFQPQDYVENSDTKAADLAEAAAVAGDCDREQNMIEGDDKSKKEQQQSEDETVKTRDDYERGEEAEDEQEEEGKNELNGRPDSNELEEESYDPSSEEEGGKPALTIEKRRVSTNVIPKIQQITLDPKKFNEKVLRDALGEEGSDNSVRGIPHCSPEEAEQEKAQFVKNHDFDGGADSAQRDDYLEMYDGENEPTESGYLLKKLLNRLRRMAQESAPRHSQANASDGDGKVAGSARAAGELCIPPQSIPQQQCHCNVPTQPKPSCPTTCSTTCPTATTCRTTTPCSSICPNRVAHLQEPTTIVHQLNSKAKFQGAESQLSVRKRHVDDTLQPLLRQIVKESAAKADDNNVKSESETDENARVHNVKNKGGQWYFSGKESKMLQRYLSEAIQNKEGLPTAEDSILMSLLKQVADNQSAKPSLNQDI